MTGIVHNSMVIYHISLEGLWWVWYYNRIEIYRMTLDGYDGYCI